MRFKTYLRHLVAYIFDRAFDLETGDFRTEEDLAKAARLHPSTVYKLRTGRTTDPKYQTIWKLLRVTKNIDISLVATEMQEIANEESS